ncbi:MAG: tryptophan synthase subunit alpha [Gammaproteobacteria bacterium]
MTSRIKPLFENLAAESRSALVTYITAGDPSPDASLSYMHALVAAGADIIELGMPFSDPMADGPVIQRASERALANGMSLAKVLDLVTRFRVDNKDTPVVLMGYLNPIESMRYEEFAKRASAAGVDGVLVVDLPPGEAREFNDAAKAHSIDQIFLISPNSDEQRVKTVSDLGGGFVYYVSVKGVTGSAALDVADVAEKLANFRQQVTLPIGVGFGIKTAEDVRGVAAISDAVIVGSAIVEEVEKASQNIGLGCERLKKMVAGYRAATIHSRREG